MVAVLTPTYNRAECLSTLFDSLCNQTDKSFKWYIIDDGSTDNTKCVVDGFISKADFPIQYIFKANGGKHTAINEGLRHIAEELTFIVDSDDTIIPDAVKTIIHYYKKHKSNDEICGFAFLKQYPNGGINGKRFKSDELIDSYINVRINDNDANSDKAEVFFTRCLKEFPFPEYDGEKFLGEDIVWFRMARKYKMVHVNKAIYIADYLGDGLTNNRRKHNITSPVGCMHRAEEFMEKDIKLKYRIKGALQYFIYGKFAGYNMGTLFSQSKYRILTALCYFPAFLLYVKWKHDFNVNGEC